MDQIVQGLDKHRFIGFSDATFLHQVFRIEYKKYYPGKNLITIHGPMPCTSFFSPIKRQNDINLTFNAMIETELNLAFPIINTLDITQGKWSRFVNTVIKLVY